MLKEVLVKKYNDFYWLLKGAQIVKQKINCLHDV